MSSERQIAANRENAKKSTGARSRRGKWRASRNAARHGLAAVNFGDRQSCDQVQRLAKAICRDESDPFRYEQAVIIAESQILLARVRAARIAAIERSRKPGNVVEQQPLIPGFPTEEEQGGILEDFARGDLRKVTRVIKRMNAALRAATKKLAAGLPIANFPRTAEAADPAKVEREERDDVECVTHALAELLTLERYERRALSRRRRAIRRFDRSRNNCSDYYSAHSTAISATARLQSFSGP
jgi:hypothetical protein